MPMMPVTRIKPRLCPYCGYHFDAVGVTAGEEVPPSEGDASMCLNCAEVTIFDGAGNMNVPTPEQRTALATDPAYADVRQNQAKLRELQRLGFRTAQAKRDRGRAH